MKVLLLAGCLLALLAAGLQMPSSAQQLANRAAWGQAAYGRYRDYRAGLAQLLAWLRQSGPFTQPPPGQLPPGYLPAPPPAASR